MSFIRTPSSIARMTNELLGEVFISHLATIGETRRDGTVVGSVEQARLDLMAVSHNWRDPALGNHHVWSMIEVGPYVHPNYILLCLQRSGVVPLNIRIYSFNPRSHPPTGAIHPIVLDTILLALLPCIARWHSFSFITTDPSLYPVLSQHLPEPSFAHTLSHLAIHILIPMIPLPLDTAPALLDEGHPSLSSLSLAFCPLPMPDNDFVSIRRLVLWESTIHWTSDGLAELLQSMPVLEDLHLRQGLVRNPESDMFAFELPLPQLVALTLTDMSPRTIINFLRSISTPALTHFTLDLKQCDPDEEVYLAQFISHLASGDYVFSATLHHLVVLAFPDIATHPSVSIDLSAFFHAFPMVRSITLDFTVMPSLFWSALFHAPYSFLPSLSKATFTGVPMANLQEFVLQRVMIERPLQSLVCFVRPEDYNIPGLSFWLAMMVPYTSFDLQQP